jgi:hypothetical protein
VGPLEIVAVKVTASPYVDGEPELATVSVGAVAFTFSCKAKVSKRLPAVAVSVTDCAVATGNTVAVNTVLAAFAGTVTVPGTVTAGLLLDRFTLSPPDGAAALSVNVQESVPGPAMDALLQKRALNTAVLPWFAS